MTALAAALRRINPLPGKVPRNPIAAVAVALTRKATERVMNRPEDRTGEASLHRGPQAEAIQPDPQLQLSEGSANWLQIVLVAFGCMLVVGITIYGLGRPATTDGNVLVSAPPAQETTGAAQPAPQTGASVPGGENIAPAGEMPQNIPAKEPVPHLVKPGAVGSDSVR